jgi:hypothetical protein
VPHVLALTHDRQFLYAGSFTAPAEILQVQVSPISDAALFMSQAVRHAKYFTGGVLTNLKELSGANV